MRHEKNCAPCARHDRNTARERTWFARMLARGGFCWEKESSVSGVRRGMMVVRSSTAKEPIPRKARGGRDKGRSRKEKKNSLRGRGKRFYFKSEGKALVMPGEKAKVEEGRGRKMNST